MPTIPTLPTSVPEPVRTAIRRLNEHAESVQGILQLLKGTVEGLPRPLTLEEINRALSATGSHPLNLTGLIGPPAAVQPPPPTPPPGPVPPTPPPISNHADVVAGVKANLQAMGVDLSGPCGAFQIVKGVVWILQGEGAGLLEKSSGNNCLGYSTDVLVYLDGQAFDMLGDPGGANTTQWVQISSVDPSRWRPPIAP